jgi:hypothetical protein
LDGPGSQRSEERGQGFGGVHHKLNVARCARAFDFAPDAIQRRSRDPAGRRRTAPLRRGGGRTRDFGEPARLHDQGTGRDHPGQLRVAEFAEQAPDIAVDRLLPEILPRLEIPADQGRADPGIEARGIQGQQSAFAVSRDSDGRGTGEVLVCEPVDRGEHLLHFVPDDVPAILIGHPVDPLAVGLIGHCGGDAAPGVAAIDEHGNQHLASALGETARELRGRVNARRQSGEHLRRPVRIGHSDDSRLRRAVGFEQQAFGVDIVEDGPADGIHAVALPPGNLGGDGGGCRVLQCRHRDAGIDCPNQAAEFLTARGNIGFRERRPPLRGCRRLARQKFADCVYHPDRRVARHGQRLGTR